MKQKLFSSALIKILVTLCMFAAFVLIPHSAYGATKVKEETCWSGSGNPNTKTHSVSIPTGYVNMYVVISNNGLGICTSPGAGTHSVSPGQNLSVTVGAIGGAGSCTVVVYGDIPHTHKAGSWSVSATGYSRKCTASGCTYANTIMNSGKFTTPNGITAKGETYTFDASASATKGALPSVTYKWQYCKDEEWLDIPSDDERFSGIAIAKLTFNSDSYDDSITGVRCVHTISSVSKEGNDATIDWDIDSYVPVFNEDDNGNLP